MSTIQEKLHKAEHDAWLANYEATKNKSIIEYIALMDYPEVFDEEESEVEEDE